MGEKFEGEIHNPAVPTDLLELHLVLEEAEVIPEQFKEVFGNEAGV